MKCKYCDQEAMIEIVIIDGLEETTLQLCPKCFEKFLKQQSSIQTEGIFQNFNSILMDLLSAVTGETEYKKDELSVCSECGRNFQEVIDQGVGECEACASQFRREISILFKNKTEQSDEENSKRLIRFSTLRNRIRAKKIYLKNLVDREKFELACRVRDEIKGLEQELERIHKR